MVQLMTSNKSTAMASQGKLQIRNASLNLGTILIKGSDIPKLRDAQKSLKNVNRIISPKTLIVGSF